VKGRIIDGAVFDAKAEAEQIRDRARADAQAIRDDARREAEAMIARAGAHAPPSSPAIVTDAPPGKVTEISGLVARATIEGVFLGEVVRIDRAGRAPVAAEVVGFRGEDAVLLPLGELAGVSPRGEVRRTGVPLQITAGEALLGRVLDGLGHPIDQGPPIAGEAWAVDREAPPPLARAPITKPLATGVRAVDGFATLGEGQRVGLFAGSGVGKSTLLGQIARGADADVVVVGLVGERGRELGDALAGPLASARAKTVVVCAEWFRDARGARVLLLLDSLTRVARAQREVGLSAGEPPARHGYPPSVFAMLPRLVERAGTSARGSITGVYTVLVAGGDLDEPIADEVRGIVDGHLVLDRRLAARSHFPPIDVVASVSRVMPHVTDDAHRAAAAASRRRLAIYEEHRDLITLGAYKPGADRALDDAVAHAPDLERFLRQGPDDRDPLPQIVAKLTAISR